MIKNLFFLGSILLGSFSFGQTIVFQENFDEPSTRDLWMIDELDNDGDTWEYLNAALNEVPSFSGDAAFSFSWYLQAFTPDNTLKSPIVTLPTDGELALKFKVAAGDDELFEEHYAVYVIPANTEFTGSEIPVFEETLDAGYYEEAKIVSVDISEYAGQDVQFVFRHYDCEDIFYVAIDDVIVEQSALSTINVDKVKPVIYQDNNIVKISGLEKIQKIKIFDLSGKLVAEVNQSDVNISSLAKGIYIVNFYNDTEVISKKVIKK
ncbi:T9SS-dependent choice-of-anchor J family protein [Faecalibacter macacae]|uniref:T9SS C-terminal target domain-containing protein n=1 Tax=Faecalibacter macacae TaxID=1859289 RepID=A0A3L9MK97_9FLAO|nr:choice-of-anchor J domain-containing protein [Faecalibacter macacae]RLZ11724.1 T9SS C-terminal target domain-containing protein [Faecalibacter macacae]